MNKLNTRDLAANYVADLDEIEIIDFIREVVERSPNIEKAVEIMLAAKHVLEINNKIENEALEND